QQPCLRSAKGLDLCKPLVTGYGDATFTLHGFDDNRRRCVDAAERLCEQGFEIVCGVAAIAVVIAVGHGRRTGQIDPGTAAHPVVVGYGHAADRTSVKRSRDM